MDKRDICTGPTGHVVHGIPDDRSRTGVVPPKFSMFIGFFSSSKLPFVQILVGLRTQTQNAAFFERKGPKRKPWPRGRSSIKSQKMIAMRFLNASVLERKAQNRNLSWGFPLGNLLPKTRVLKHCVLERKRRPNANASVLGTQRFRTLRSKFIPEII